MARSTARQRPDASAILARVRTIPPGFVRTYRDVSPGAPRRAGAVLHACVDPDVPWHRIVRADGSLAKGAHQRELLEAEGVPFNGARVDMRVARVPDF
jgi:alkylated DNA nucleotide flippase Atl1